MGEAGSREVEGCHLQRLSLSLVDAHGKAQHDRKLEPLELKRHIRRHNGDSRDKYILTSGSACDDGGLDNMREELFDCKPGAIAELWWVKVALENDRGSNLQFEPVRRNTRQLKRVEELDRVLNSNRSVWNSVNGLVHLNSSTDLLDHLEVDVSDRKFNGARTALCVATADRETSEPSQERPTSRVPPPS